MFTTLMDSPLVTLQLFNWNVPWPYLFWKPLITISIYATTHNFVGNRTRIPLITYSRSLMAQLGFFIILYVGHKKNVFSVSSSDILGRTWWWWWASVLSSVSGHINLGARQTKLSPHGTTRCGSRLDPRCHFLGTRTISKWPTDILCIKAGRHAAKYKRCYRGKKFKRPVRVTQFTHFQSVFFLIILYETP